MATNNVSKLYEQFENKELANLIYNILIYKSDYDHNHDDKYVKLSEVYTKEEIENILNSRTLDLKDINDFDFLDNKINKAISELKNIDTNISNYLESINKIVVLEKEIATLKEENLLLKEEIEKNKNDINILSANSTPILERKDSLIYAADNIISRFKI